MKRKKKWKISAYHCIPDSCLCQIICMRLRKYGLKNGFSRERQVSSARQTHFRKGRSLSSRKYYLNTNKYNFFHFTLKTSQSSLKRNRAHFQCFLGSQHKEFSPSVTTEKWPLSAKWKLSQNRVVWCKNENIILKGHVIILFSCQKKNLVSASEWETPLPLITDNCRICEIPCFDQPKEEQVRNLHWEL